jgi:hypothetical protein
VAGKKRIAAERAQRRKDKSAKKAAQTAKYQAWRDAGTNQKSKRNVLRGKRHRKSNTKHMHLVSNCGNAGCRRCSPREPMRAFGGGFG